MLQDYCQIYYLKFFKDLRKIDIFLVAPSLYRTTLNKAIVSKFIYPFPHCFIFC